MKFLTLILSAFLVIGVVNAQKRVCYRNGPNADPKCKLTEVCIINTEDASGEVFTKCRETKDIIKVDCPDTEIGNTTLSCTFAPAYLDSVNMTRW